MNCHTGSGWAGGQEDTQGADMFSYKVVILCTVVTIVTIITLQSMWQTFQRLQTFPHLLPSMESML